MARYDDYSKEDDQQGAVRPGGSGAALGGPGGGASGAAATPQKEAEFVPWSRFVSANEDVSKGLAGKLASGVEGDIGRTKESLGKATGAFDSAIESNYEHGKKAPAASIAPQTPAQAFGGAQAQQAGAFSNYQPPPAAPAAPSRAEAIRGGGRAVAEAPADTQMTLAPVSDRSGLSANAINQPNAPKSLEDMLGADAWGKLLEQGTRAESGAKALGSEAGVEGLLQKQYASPNSAFDAALVSGAGGKRFGDVSKSGEGVLKGVGEANLGAQGAWQKLMGDIDTARRERSATEQANATNARNASASAPGAAGQTAKPTGSGWHPSDYESYEDFLGKVGAGAGAHALGTGFDPVSQGMNELGKAGLYQGPTVAEMFRGQYTPEGVRNVAGSLDDQNKANAFKQIQQQYGTEAAKYLWQWMTEAMWTGFNGKNAGAIYKTLQDAIEAAIQQGQVKRATIGAAGKKSEIQQLGGASSQSDPEAIRNGLAKGVPYTDENGKVWKSLSEWDAAHQGDSNG